MNARRAFLLAGSLLSFLPLLACAASGPDGRTDTTQQPSTGTQQPSTGARQPSTGACAASIVDHCSKNACLTTWTQADDVCMSSDPGAESPVRFSTTCGDYLALSKDGTTSYFEASTSGLVAIVDASGQCVAGPSDFVVPAAASCPLIACGMQSCGGPPDGGMP